MVCSRITLQDCAVCSLVEEIPRQKGNLARALQCGNLTKMQFYALDLKGISFHSGLAKLCLSGTVPGMALSCSENSFGVIHLFPLEFLPCLPPSICFPSVNPGLHRQLPLMWQERGQKMLKRWSLSVMVQWEPWQKCSEGAKWGWESAWCGQPGHVWCVWWICLLLCAELLKCLLGKKEKCFVGVGAAKSRFVKFLVLVFQLGGQRRAGGSLCTLGVAGPLLLSKQIPRRCENTERALHKGFLHYKLPSAAFTLQSVSAEWMCNESVASMKIQLFLLLKSKRCFSRVCLDCSLYHKALTLHFIPRIPKPQTLIPEQV